MTIKRWISSLLAITMCLSLLIVPVGAYARVDTTREVTLTLTYAYEKTGIKDLEISLYKVYDMTDAVRFTPTDAFLDAYGPQAAEVGEFNFDLNAWPVKDAEGNVLENQVNWTGMAKTLESLLQRDSDAPKVEPLLTQTTDENGKVKFESTEAAGETEAITLTAGLYLVMGKTLVNGRYTYTPQTFLVSLPHLMEEDVWNYDLAAYGKLSGHYAPPSGGTTTSVTVVKVWVDEGVDVERPSSVQVQLLRNGTVYETATLDEGSGWQKTWTNLSDEYTWTVAEASVPEGYSVSVSQNNQEFIITNAAEAELEDDDTPLGPNPDGEGDDPGDLPDVDLDDDDVPLGNLPDENLDDGDTPLGGLPQTGILWWPVQLLTVAGIVLFSLGWLDMRRNQKRSHEK